MSDVQPIAGKARAIERALTLMAPLRHDVATHAPELRELVDTVNALLIPKGWVGLDASGSLHVTYVAPEDRRARNVHLDGSVAGRPLALGHHADFVWEYSTLNRTVECVKCRDGSVAQGEVRPWTGPVQTPDASG